MSTIKALKSRSRRRALKEKKCKVCNDTKKYLPEVTDSNIKVECIYCKKG